ncbi:MAG: efflux RND transporter permease subunit [Planctomycetes bacterium]|nr:efflux RND transporter permease subunit [Planctomycetota bacterium]
MNEANPDRTGGIFRVVARRPVAVLCVVAAFLVFGFVSLTQLPITLMPDINYPTLTVRTDYPAAAPADVEEKVSREIEDRLGSVPGLVRRSSISRAEQSDVLLEFAWGTNMLQATADVRDRVDRARLDTGVGRPQILRYDPAQDATMRLMLYATGSDVSLMDLRAFADDVLKSELGKIDGVAAVRVSGGAERQVRIALREPELNRNKITAAEVVTRLRNARVDVSAGTINLAGQDVILRVVSTYEALDVLKDLEIAAGGERGRVLLKDIADVSVMEKERDTVTRFAGADTNFAAREGVMLEILKVGDANVVKVARAVWAALYGADRYEPIRKKRGEAEPAPRGGSTPGATRSSSRGGFSMRGGSMGGARSSSFSFSSSRSLVDQLPEGFGLRVISDQSYFIEDAVNDVASNAALGAILSILVIFVFLRSGKITLLNAVSIPLCIAVTFIPMRIFNISLNLMSLGGLAMGVGMVVDNSTVVLESISRCRDEGDGPLTAAIRGTSEVGGAIVASTMTSVAVFFPIVFVTGIAGQVFRDQALTVVFALLASLVVALFVVPPFFGLHAAATGGGAFSLTRRVVTFAKPKPEFTRGQRVVFWLSLIPQLPLWIVALVIVAILDAVTAAIGGAVRVIKRVLHVVFRPIGFAFDLGWKALEEIYPLILRPLLHQPLLMLAAVLAAAVITLSMARGLETELLPSFQQDEIYADVSAPEGTRIEVTDAQVKRVVEDALKSPALRADVARISAESGGEGNAGDNRPLGPHRARMVVTLASRAEPAKTVERVHTRIRAAIDDDPLLQGSAEFSAPVLFSLNTGLAVELRGENFELLGDAARILAAAMERAKRDDGKPMFSEVRVSLSAGRPQVALRFDREQLERYGLTAEAVTRAVRIKVGGEVSTQFSSRGEDIDVFVELGGADKSTLDRVLDMEVAPGARLKDVLPPGSRPEITEGPSEIRRVGNERAVLVFAQPNGVALGASKKRIEELAAAAELSGAAIGFSGQAGEMEESILSLVLALTLAVFLVYVVMAVQFENLIDPLVIMFSVPFAGVGVVMMLLILRQPVSIMVLLGLIVLAGIVVNNAIVLVDYANLLRTRGMTSREAALAAGKLRLRPIAITTLTTVLGLLPMSGWMDFAIGPMQGAAQGIDGWIGGIAASMGRGLSAPMEWPLIGGWSFSFKNGLNMLVGGGEGAEVRKPLAVTVMVGLTTSTLLTLLVVPTLWAWVNGRKDNQGGKLQATGDS